MTADTDDYALSQYVYIKAKFEIPSGDNTYETKYGTLAAHVSENWDPPGSSHSYGAKARTYASATYN